MSATPPKTVPVLPKPVYWVATLLYVLISILQYWFCYDGYVVILDQHFNPWVPVALVCFTVMFRLDIIAAIIGFYGAWKGEGPHFSEVPWLHLPQPLAMWQALLISALFLGLSYVVDIGGRVKPRRWLVRQLWRRNQSDKPTYVPGTGYGAMHATPNAEAPVAMPPPAASAEEAVPDPNAPKPKRRTKKPPQD